MTYSMQEYPNEQSQFPPPPMWLTWEEAHHYNYTTRSSSFNGEGQVRHHDTLAVAKKNTGRANGDGLFFQTWAIYEWDATTLRYVKRFEGKKGESRKDHPLWKRGAVPKGGTFRPVSDDDLSAVMASLAGVLE